MTQTAGQSAPTGKEQETLLTSPLPSLFPLLSPSYPSRFSSPPVLDARIWSKGLSLSWELKTDHLLLAENSNFLVWFLVGPSSSPPFAGSPGKSPVTLGVCRWQEMSVSPPLLPPFPASSSFFFQPGFLSSCWNLWRYLKFCVSIEGFLRDCILVFKGVSDEDCQVYMCVLTLFCVVICDGYFALSGHHLDLPPFC